MKILYSHYLASDDHPAVRMIEAIAERLRERKHDVCIHRSFGPASQNSGPGMQERRERRLTLAAARRRLWFARAIARNRGMVTRDRAAINRFQPDIVLARQDAYCWSMPLVCRQENVPLVTYADAPVAYETRLFGEPGRWHPPGLVESIEKWGLRRSRAIITVSHPAARRLRQYRLDVPIHVVPNGVHPDRFPAWSPEAREAQRRSLGLSGKCILGFQGTFRPFHGLDVLRELMFGSSAIQHAEWLLIGDGPLRPPLEEAVEGRVAAKFLGRQPPQQIGRLLGLIDVAVVPHAQLAGDFYFCPLKILEFAAAGCAVLASEQGDIPRLLDDGRAGVLVSQPNAADWLAALERLVRDAPYRQSLGRRARDFVLSHYTWDHTAERVELILRQVLGDSEKSIAGAEPLTSAAGANTPT
jgi:glycosyltransferase involved in cell wall biosynthesis